MPLVEILAPLLLVHVYQWRKGSELAVLAAAEAGALRAVRRSSSIWCCCSATSRARSSSIFSSEAWRLGGLEAWSGGGVEAWRDADVEVDDWWPAAWPRVRSCSKPPRLQASTAPAPRLHASKPPSLLRPRSLDVRSRRPPAGRSLPVRERRMDRPHRLCPTNGCRSRPSPNWSIARISTCAPSSKRLPPGGNARPGSIAQQVADLYASMLNQARIEELGAAPMAPELQKIDAIRSTRDVAAEAGYLSSIAWAGRSRARSAPMPAIRRSPSCRSRKAACCFRIAITTSARIPPWPRFARSTRSISSRSSR